MPIAAVIPPQAIRRPDRLTRAVLAVLTGVALALILIRLRVPWTNVQWSDFQLFYDSGRAWLTGADLYATAIPRHPNLNPPHFIVAFAALSWLPVKSALAIWLALNVASMVAAIALIFNTLDIRCSLTTIQAAVVVTGLCAGVLLAFEVAQVTGVLMLPMTIAWRASRRHAWITCGVVLGLVVSVKPFFALLLLIPLLRRRYLACASAVIAAAAAVSIGVALAGVASLQRWIEVGRLVDWFQHPANASLLGLLARTGTIPWDLFLVLSACAVIVTAVIARTARSLDFEWAAFGLVSLLVSPLGWCYYLPLVAGPLVAVARSRPAVAWAAVGFMWPVPALMALAPATPWATLSLGSLQSWSLVAAWATLVVTQRRQTWRSARTILLDCVPLHNFNG